MIHDAFEYLGLAPDADEKAIKRAYAQRLKTCRPDENPAGFQRLTDAYQQALQWCSGQARPMAVIDAPVMHGAPADAEPDAPSHLKATPATTHAVPPRASQEALLRELASVAARGDPGLLRAHLENHPDLWSLQLKQQVGTALLRELTRRPIPMPATCFDTLLAYFELDQVARGADGLLLARLRENCHQHYAPIGRYLTQQPMGEEPEPRFEQAHFLARLLELCTAGDPGNLWAWLHLQTTPWTPVERQHAGRAALTWLRTDPVPMPRECYEPLAGCFGWPDDALCDDAEATQSELADRHLAWLLLPAHTSHLARAVQDPLYRRADIPKTHRLRDLLTRPFGWPRTLLHSLSLYWPRELADFIFRLRAAAGLKGKQVRLLEKHLDARSLRFWSEARAPGRLTSAKLTTWGLRAAVALVIEVTICALVGWQMGTAVFGERYLGTVALATLGLALYAVAFDLLLFWQTLPGPHSRLATLGQVSFVPLLCAISFGATALRPPHYVSGGVAITALLLALLTYMKRDRANRTYAKAVLLLGGIMVIGPVLRDGELSNGWTAGFALVFWVMDLAATDRIASAGR